MWDDMNVDAWVSVCGVFLHLYASGGPKVTVGILFDHPPLYLQSQCFSMNLEVTNLSQLVLGQSLASVS